MMYFLRATLASPVLSLTEMFLLIQLAPSCIVLHALAYFLADTHQALLLFKETFTF